MLRSLRGILEFAVAALCIWAGAYHTPGGAVLRAAGAWLRGGETSAPPLLSYYGGEGGTAIELAWREVAGGLPEGLIEVGELPPAAALGLGAYTSLMQLEPARRQPARELARRHGLDAGKLEDRRAGPEQLSALVRALAADLGSEDVAVLALMCGDEPARYAQERARAEGRPASIEHLARQLPPQFEAPSRLAAQALALAVVYGLSWPVDLSVPISSAFGMRWHPILGRHRMHTGVDLPVPEGTAIRTVAAGVVRRAGEDAVNGKVLVIDHGYGVSTAYCHNQALEVRVGQVVTRGQRISRSGSTGRSTGPHLHYQLELGGAPVDPLRYRPAAGTSSRVKLER